MRKSNLPLLFIIILLFSMLAACSGEGISGSASGGRQSMRSSAAGGSANGSYKRIKGTFGASFETSAGSDDYVLVDVTASVETGGLRIFLKGPEGDLSEVTLDPGQSGSVSGKAELDFDDEFRVYFEALDEEAEGVEYDLTFRYQE